MITFDTIAAFSWNFGKEFLLEVGGRDENGDPLPNCEKFIWSDPDYGGDNTIRKANMPQDNVPVWRWKGWHKIRDYCGGGVKIL